jgi:hypothetical protein
MVSIPAATSKSFGASGKTCPLFEVPSGYTKMQGGGMLGGAERAARMEEAMQTLSPEQRAIMKTPVEALGRREE